ncbi:MAG: hypothetical protein GY714_04750 [Desulfobacterales bacterium]|nr:hypothetical protein [Desulfobacterales bacterium]
MDLKGSVMDAIQPIGIFMLITVIGLWYNDKSYEVGKSSKDTSITVTKGMQSGEFLPIIAVATGTSWGTNSIHMPITIPVTAVSIATLESTALMGVLTGTVFYDNCSPISDTTILSSMASGSNHIDHVKTQIPNRVFKI